MGNTTITMTKDQFIQQQVATWGEDYIFDLIDKGYEAVEYDWNGTIRWWWVLTQPQACATIPASRPVVSPVSTG